jgi:hypothetical protein
MSLETKIEALTKTVEQLIQVISAQGVSANVAQGQPVAPAAAPVVAQPAPAPAAPVAAAMPAAPFLQQVSPQPAAPAQQVVTAPFSTGPELVKYVMTEYTAMGAQKGAGIQNILVSLGYQNINDVQPAHYGALYQAIEALKAS